MPRAWHTLFNAKNASGGGGIFNNPADNLEKLVAALIVREGREREAVAIVKQWNVLTLAYTPRPNPLQR